MPIFDLVNVLKIMQIHSSGKKLKICLVSISLSKGGAERSCSVLSKLLSDLGHSVTLVTLNSGVDYAYSGRLFDLGTLKKEKDTVLSRLLRFRKLRLFLVKQKFDVIIDHRSKNNYRRELFYANYIYKNLKKIYVVHSSNASQYLTEKPQKFIKNCLKNTTSVAVSNYIEKEILQKHGIKNTITIYNAFLHEWQEDNLPLPKEIKDKIYVLSYGRIDDTIKDFSFLLDSFKASRLWEKEIFLVIMGDGKDKKMLQTKAKELAIEKRVIFLPFIKNPFSIIKHAKCVTLTSKYEGFPMVLLESLSVGTPVISLDIVSGPNEIIKSRINGLLVSERNISLFAEALQTMFSNEALYKALKQNAQPSVEEFSFASVVKKWDAVLERMFVFDKY